MQEDLEKYFDRLWPICRSLTGDGIRESFKILQEIIPLGLTEVPSGTQVFDWKIPKEWNIEDAYIITPNGDKICDFKQNNLHVVGYSTPIDKELTFDELKPHLHTLEDQLNAIPYLTSYYRENWGFCITQNELNQLPKEGKYKVVIQSSLEDGSLTYGDFVLPGETDQEILFSTYLCHPSMANNELSGPLALAFLYNEIKKIPKRKYTYRFIIAPETVGVIAYLAKHGEHLKQKLLGGYVLTCCGDSGDFTYKMSKNENSIIDSISKHVLKYSELSHSIIPFAVGGSDERQYCSPGFNFSVGSLMRTPYQKFKEYHTSLDNKDFISFEALEETVNTYFQMIELLEINEKYFNKIQFCEPQLGKRGLYPSSVNPEFNRTKIHRLLHFLSFADGKTDLIEIAEKRGESALHYKEVIQKTMNKELISVQ